MTNYASPVEDVATAIAATVRAKGWEVLVEKTVIALVERGDVREFCQLWCKDASQATRLAAMMRGE